MTSARFLLASTSLLALAATPAFSAEFTPLDQAVAKAEGAASANALAPGLNEVPVAIGFMPVENASGAFPFYGFAGDGDMIPAYGAAQQENMHVEATKTEPDKNTYLVLDGATGPAAGLQLRYGISSSRAMRAAPSMPMVTRSAHHAHQPRRRHAAHRVTLMAEKDVNGDPIPTIDGSAWDPFAEQLLFTAELGAHGGVWQATADFPSEGRTAPRHTGPGRAMRACRSTRTGQSGWSRMRRQEGHGQRPRQAAELLRLPVRAEGHGRSDAGWPARGAADPDGGWHADQLPRRRHRRRHQVGGDEAAARLWHDAEDGLGRASTTPTRTAPIPSMPTRSPRRRVRRR